MGEKLVHLASVKEDNGLWSISDMLQEARKDLERGEISANKAIVVFLDDTNKGYCVSHYQTDLCRSEIVALMEYVKAGMIRAMTEGGE